MSKSQRPFAQCPACRQPKHKTEIQTAIALLEKAEKQGYKHYSKLKVDAYSSFINSDFDWACDSCFAQKVIIEAKPSAQNYCWQPHLVYFDKTFVCQTCSIDFVFDTAEQQFWYEELKFWHESIPNHCPNCRKEIRQLSIENKTISDILKKPIPDISLAELERVVAIYTKWQKLERAKYYQSIIRKKLKKRPLNQS